MTLSINLDQCLAAFAHGPSVGEVRSSVERIEAGNASNWSARSPLSGVVGTYCGIEFEEPDRLWVADITYIRTAVGFLYLAVVLDVFSRRIVGWAMASHLRTSLVLQALDMAFEQRSPLAVIHHSDQGSQYTSLAFGKRWAQLGSGLLQARWATATITRCARASSLTSSANGSNVTAMRPWSQARRSVFYYIEGWYNPHRRYSALGQISPAEFERRAMRGQAPSDRDRERQAESFDDSKPSGVGGGRSR